ncbi:hypothetical protein [Zoogloea sp.]|uniref:hypothetical protein n=1 Tax=Zoogloea sp. TaxID=49181 RepID=UPI0025EA6383|nr:hypothetical protein [Zoogloea sp.]MCK6394606.1 hypothetical protein [Zoogloea sp.]
MELDDGPKALTMIGKLLRVLNPRWHLLKREVARQHAGPYVERSDAGYTIAIICRGEQLLYTDENGSLVLEICIPGRWVDASSISKWDEVGSVSERQRATIVGRIKRYFEDRQGFSVHVINRDKMAGPGK